ASSLTAEYPAPLGEVLDAEIRELRALADDDLGDRVEIAVELRVAREKLLHERQLGLVLDDDQRPPRQRALAGGLDRGEDDRYLHPQPPRHEDECAATPRHRVLGREPVPVENELAEMGLHELRVLQD